MNKRQADLEYVGRIFLRAAIKRDVFYMVLEIDTNDCLLLDETGEIAWYGRDIIREGLYSYFI